MTTVACNDIAPIGKAHTLLPLFSGSGDRAKVRVGAEIERTFHATDDARHFMPTQAQNAVCSLLRESDGARRPDGPVSISQEATSYVIEDQTRAHPIDQPTNLIKEHYRNTRTIHQAAQSIGMRQSIISNSPFHDLDACLATPNADRTGRIDAFVGKYKEFFGTVEPLKYGLMTSPLHLSISYENFDHLFDIARRSFYLAPLMYMISENSGGFREGKAARATTHYIMRPNMAHGARGGIPPYFFESGCGEEYAARHIDWVMKSRMFMYFDRDGHLVVPRSVSEMPSIETLRASDLATRANFNLAESMTWPCGKICNLRTRDGESCGKRFEIRAWDTGPSQFNSMVIFASVLIFNARAGAEVDDLLADFGFPAQPQAAREPLTAAMNDACHHGGRFMKVPYGRFTQKALASELLPILEHHLRQRTDGLAHHAGALMAVLELAETETQVVAKWVKSIDGLAWLMRAVDDQIYRDESGPSFLLLREKERLPTPPAAGRDVPRGLAERTPTYG